MKKSMHVKDRRNDYTDQRAFEINFTNCEKFIITTYQHRLQA